MTDIKDTLAACPFCGGEALIVPSGEWQYFESGSIDCDCGASLHHDEDMRRSGADWRESIIVKWNTRP